MTNRVALRLNFAKKVALAGAGMAAVAAPIVVGILNAPAATLKFEVASVKPCRADVAPVTVQFRVRDFLIVVAILNETGKFVDLPIQRRGCKSLTAIATLG